MGFIALVLLGTSAFGQQAKFKITYSYNYKAEWAFSMIFPNDSSMWINTGYSPNSGGHGFAMLQVSNTGAINTQKRYEKNLHSYSVFGLSPLQPWIQIST